MNIGRVNIDTDINPTMDGGTTKHVLSFSVSNARDFTSDVTHRKPEACLVFSRSVPGEPLKNPFKRVCTLDEFFVLPHATGSSGARDELYRDTTYYWEYEDYNTALADQEDLSRQVHAFYNNLNNYVTGHSGPEARKSYVFPDYEVQLLDSLIIQLRTLRFENARDEERSLIIKNTVLPLLGANYSMYESLYDAAELLLKHAEDVKKNAIDMSLFKDQVAELTKNITRVNANIQINRTRIQDGVGSMAVIKNLLTGSPTLADEEKSNILKSLNSAVYGLNPAAETPDILTPPEASHLASGLMPGIAFVEAAEHNRYTDLTTVETLLALVKDFGVSVDREREKRTQELEELNKLIQLRRGEIQVVEAKLKQIRPSIDVTNPESAWYLTININR